MQTTGRNGHAIMVTIRWVQFDARHLAEAGVACVEPGDLSRDSDDETWRINAAKKRSNGSVKATFMDCQELDPLNPLLNPQG